MAGSRRFGQLAFAKQTGTGDFIINRPGGTGTLPAGPLFTVPVLDGQVGPTKEYGDLPRIGSTLARLGRFAQRARAGGTVQMLCHPEALGLLLYNITGLAPKTAPTTGGGTLHRFTMTDVFGPPLTVWSSVGNFGAGFPQGSVYRNEDCFVQRLSIQGSSGENVIVEAEFVGFSYNVRNTIPALTGTGNSAEDATPRMKFIGSTVKLDPAGTAPTQVVLPNSIDFTIDRAPDIRYGTQLTPASISPDRMVNASFGMDYDDAVLAWEFLNRSMTGGNAQGGTPEQGVAKGSIDVTLGRHPVSDVTDGTTGAKRLQIVSGGATYTPPATPTPAQNWEYTMERPSASGEPDALTYDLDGQLVAPGGSQTSEVNILLVNDFVGPY